MRSRVHNRHAVTVMYGSEHADGSVKRPTGIAGYYHPSLLKRLWYRFVKKVPLLSKDQAKHVVNMKEGH